MKTEPPTSGPAEPPGAASSPAQILPLLSQTGRLADWIQTLGRYGGTLQISDADMCETSIEFELPRALSTEVTPVDRYS